MAGYAIELIFKSLAWIGGADIQATHEIRPFYRGFDDDMKAKVNSVAMHNGWTSADDLVDYVDTYLKPVNRRYFGISTRKSFTGLHIKKDARIYALANVHQSICKEISVRLKSPIK